MSFQRDKLNGIEVERDFHRLFNSIATKKCTKLKLASWQYRLNAKSENKKKIKNNPSFIIFF